MTPASLMANALVRSWHPTAPCGSIVTKAPPALDPMRTFPFGSLASQVCPYCYNTGYSSPGTRCSYCRQKSHL
jgi:hypothetical protein